MTMTNPRQYNDKLKELERQKEELERQIIEEKSKAEDIVLAEYLHDALCTDDHMQYCSWHCNSWSQTNLNGSSARAVYLRKANALLKLGYTIADVKEIIDIINQ